MTNEQNLAFALIIGFCVAIPIELAECISKLEAEVEIASVISNNLQLTNNKIY
jgi:hypothetical protein